MIILDSGEINAFATPGGHIFITRGLVDLAPSEDALAGVIAHELAHIQLKHGVSIIEDARFFDEVDEMAKQAEHTARRKSAAAEDTIEKTAALRNAVSGIMDALIKDGYSHEQEYEAEAAALLAAAGYDSGGLAEMLNALRRVQGSQSGGFNVTHPSPARRIEKLNSVTGMPGNQHNRPWREARFRRFISGR